jgi:hypothetical protein
MAQWICTTEERTHLGFNWGKQILGRQAPRDRGSAEGIGRRVSRPVAWRALVSEQVGTNAAEVSIGYFKTLMFQDAD